MKAWSPESKLTIIQRAALANSVQQSVMEIALNDFLEFPRDATGATAASTAEARPWPPGITREQFKASNDLAMAGAIANLKLAAKQDKKP